MRSIAAAVIALVLGLIGGYLIREEKPVSPETVRSIDLDEKGEEAPLLNAQANPQLAGLERRIRAMQSKLDKIADLVGKTKEDSAKAVSLAIEPEKLRVMIGEACTKSEFDRDKRAFLKDIDDSIANSTCDSEKVDAAQDYRDDARAHVVWLEKFRKEVEAISDPHELKKAAKEFIGQ